MQTYSESELVPLVTKLAESLRGTGGGWVFLEGDLGAGKSTFARLLLKALGVSEGIQHGSPTFSLSHEYRCGNQRVVHLDLYRIRSEEEIDEAGLEELFSVSSSSVVLVEWLSKFPDFEESLLKLRQSKRIVRVKLDFIDCDPLRRKVEIKPL